MLSDFENQLKKIESGDVDEKKAVQNIQNLGGAMASYNSVKASSVNKEEGQLKLNRYYNILKEIGSNAIPQSQKFFNNKDLINEFLADIKKAENYQEAVFDFYKVDRESLKKNE